MLNPIDKNQRGIGRSFQFSGDSGAKTFVERDVSMDDFERLFGNQELTEEQRRNLTMDPYSRAYILCQTCENRIGVIENYFYDNVYSKITVKDDMYVEAALVSNNLLIRLFFLSLIWRASAGRFDFFNLPTLVEERIRKIIHYSSGNDLNETIELASKNEEIILNEALFCYTTRYFCDITANQITIFGDANPYFLEINEHTICFFDDKHDLRLKQRLFGIEKYISDSTINLNESKFKICLIESDDWNLKRNLIFQYAAAKFQRHLLRTFLESYRIEKSKIPTWKIIDAFMREVIHGTDATLALRYTDERIGSLIDKYIKM